MRDCRMMGLWGSWLVLAIALLASGCDDDNLPPTFQPVDDPDVVEARIGQDGGELTSSDGRLTLTIPAGALASRNTITITTTSPEDLPSEFDDVEASEGYELAPEGLVFEQPVTATFNTGEDARQDGSTTLALSLNLLLSRENGAPVPLASLAQRVDPETGLVEVSGTLDRLEPLARVVDPSTLLVFGVPEGTQAADAGFTADASFTFNSGGVLDSVESALFTDTSTAPIQCQSAECEAVDLPPEPMEPDRFSGTFDYGCTGAGTGGRWGAEFSLDAMVDNSTVAIVLGLTTDPIECVAP